MCTVSMIGDHYRGKWFPAPEPHPWGIPGVIVPTVTIPPVTRQEFDQLRAEVEEMKALLARAKKYDEDNGEPNCEIDEKMDLLRQVAKLVGVDLDDVLGQRNAQA